MPRGRNRHARQVSASAGAALLPEVKWGAPGRWRSASSGRARAATWLKASGVPMWNYARGNTYPRDLTGDYRTLSLSVAASLGFVCGPL